MQTIIALDIGSNKLRNRIEDDCRDQGMQRIQWSLFQGELNPARRRALVAAMQNHVDEHKENEGKENKAQALVIHLFTVCAADFENALEINRNETKQAPQICPQDVVIL